VQGYKIRVPSKSCPSDCSLLGFLSHNITLLEWIFDPGILVTLFGFLSNNNTLLEWILFIAWLPYPSTQFQFQG
jgi:hypothetical protein